MNYDTLQILCKKRGTTPTGLLKKLGMSTGNISRWKAGIDPRFPVATKMCEELGCSLDELLGIEKPTAPEGEQSEPTEHQRLVKELTERAAHKSAEALTAIIAMMDQIENRRKS